MPQTDRLEEATRLWEKLNSDGAIVIVMEVLAARQDIKTVRIKEALDLRNKGNYDGAKEILQNSIKDAGGGVLIGELMHHLGTVEQGAKNFEVALKYLRAAFWVRTDAGDALGAAYSAFQIPMCRRVAGEPDDPLIEDFRTARDAISSVISGPERLSLSDEHMGNMLQNLAFCLQVERDFAKAIERYNEVLPYRYRAADRRGAAMTFARIAECELEIGQIDNAAINARTALGVFREIGDVNRTKQVEALIQKISAHEGNESSP